jgi:hypothetical protein
MKTRFYVSTIVSLTGLLFVPLLTQASAEPRLCTPKAPCVYSVGDLKLLVPDKSVVSRKTAEGSTELVFRIFCNTYQAVPNPEKEAVKHSSVEVVLKSENYLLPNALHFHHHAPVRELYTHEITLPEQDAIFFSTGAAEIYPTDRVYGEVLFVSNGPETETCGNTKLQIIQGANVFIRNHVWPRPSGAKS